MPNITKDHAVSIAQKLNRKPQDRLHEALVVESKKGRGHDIYQIKYRGVFIGQFNIRRGSRRDELHNFISEQLHLSRQEGYDLARCPMSIDDFIVCLQNKEIIPQDEDRKNEPE